MKPNAHAGRLERRVRLVGRETMPGTKPDGLCNPVRNVLCLGGVLGHAQNVSDGVTNPVAPISHTPARFAFLTHTARLVYLNVRPDPFLFKLSDNFNIFIN